MQTVSPRVLFYLPSEFSTSSPALTAFDGPACARCSVSSPPFDCLSTVHEEWSLVSPSLLDTVIEEEEEEGDEEEQTSFCSHVSHATKRTPLNISQSDSRSLATEKKATKTAM